jgi:hypothetical protein
LASKSESAAWPRLTEKRVIAQGGWHPRYARAVAIATDSDFGLALVDGKGDGAELADEIWMLADGGQPRGRGRSSRFRKNPSALTVWSWPAEPQSAAFRS